MAISDRRARVRLISIGAAAAAFAATSLAADAQAPQAQVSRAEVPQARTSSDRPTLAPLLKQVVDGVVNVSVTSTGSAPSNPLTADPFFRRFFDLPEQSAPQPQQSVGSGVIVDAAKGYVLTNHHVVDKADEIMITLADRRTVPAKLVGSDAGTDVALLQIDASHGLKAIPLGDSDKLEVGDFVVAIGNPFALGQTVTSGIVSALGRSGISEEGFESFIQTDASINPGNSGGALIDLDGRLVGINSAILTPAGGNVGIGFAVPANMAKQVMQQLIEYGHVRRGRLGVSVQTLTPDLAEALGLDVQEGAVVNAVEPGSAGEKAGLQPRDIVVRFGGMPVMSAADLRNKVGLSPVGTSVPLTVIRDGKNRELEARIAETPDTARGSAEGQPSERLTGVVFRDLMRGDPQYGKVQGALVARIDEGSPAARSGLMPGDVVTAVNRTAVKSAADLSRALQAVSGTIALSVVRGDAQIYVVVR